jgi:23S rRNA (adenine2503-C2)-methyltransferase
MARDAVLNFKALMDAAHSARQRIASWPLWQREAVQYVSDLAASPEARSVLHKLSKEEQMAWNKINIVESSDTSVLKYVFEKGDAVAESVLYKYPTYEQRTVICCSTQSGCPVGCRFCGAGDNFVRSLSAEEIVSQPVHLLNDKNIDASNVQRMQIMFMSMGEPLLNFKELEKALHILYEKFPKAALLISTSAPKVDMTRVNDVSSKIPTIGLQFSVHESTDEARDKLIPFKNKMTLREISEAGSNWYKATNRSPFFNYCAHEGNVSEEDADRIKELFDPNIWEATISVVCERDEHVAAANERQRDLAVSFRAKLGKRGFSTRVFDPAGQDDCGGGCGQLWYVQDWMKEHPELARPSIGSGKDVVHAPRLNVIK